MTVIRSILAFLLLTAPLLAAVQPAMAQSFGRDGVVGVPAAPGASVLPRPVPPRAGAQRCIGVDSVAGAILYGDRAVELVMKSGQRWRLYLGRTCPALSFYQGFYYRRGQNGKLCASRDVVIARSGGECVIASIMPAGRARR